MNEFLLFAIMVCQTGGYPAEQHGLKCVPNHMSYFKTSNIKQLDPVFYVNCRDTEYETDEDKRAANGPNRFLKCEKNIARMGCSIYFIDGTNETSAKSCRDTLNGTIFEGEIP